MGDAMVVKIVECANHPTPSPAAGYDLMFLYRAAVVFFFFLVGDIRVNYESCLCDGGVVLWWNGDGESGDVVGVGGWGGGGV